MNVKFYHTGSPKNKVSKKLSGEHEYVGVIFHEPDALDVLNPTIIINGITDVADISKYNYFYIPKFTRYYYISDIKYDGSRAIVTGEVDVLMSWKSDIRSSKQYISRQQHAPELYSLSRYYVDNMLPISSKKDYAIKQFGNAVDDRNCNCVILETVGKAVVVDD